MEGPSREWTRTARYSFGQFYLAGGGPAPVFDFHLPSVVARANEAGGIAQQDSFVVVLSPRERSSDMVLRVELWSDDPPDDDASWQEGFLTRLLIHPASPAGVGALSFDNVDWSSRLAFDVEPGLYNVRINGRGFDAVAHDEEWRICLWPSGSTVESDVDPRPRRTSSYEPPSSVPAEPRFRDAGVAAVRRIHRDLDDDRAFSGVQETVTVERTLPARRAKIYEHFRYPLWLTVAGARRPFGFMLEGVNEVSRHSEGELYADERKIVACNGLIECEHLDGQAPLFSLSSWMWVRLPPERILPQARDGRPGAILVSTAPITLRFDLDETAGSEGRPATTVRVTHDKVPTEWVADLTAYWEWMLERADHQLDLVKP